MDRPHEDQGRLRNRFHPPVLRLHATTTRGGDRERNQGSGITGSAVDERFGSVTAVALRRLIHSVTNGTWGDEPGTGGTDVLCIRAADFDFERLAVDMARAPLRAVDSRSLDRLLLAPGDL